MIEWIPTTEKLPRKGRVVLFKLHRPKREIHVGFYDEEAGLSGFETQDTPDFFRLRKVSHWAPINFPD